MRHAIAYYPEHSTRGCQPDEYEVDNSDIVAQVEEEVMPRAFLVVIDAEWKKDRSLDRIRDVYPP